MLLLRYLLIASCFGLFASVAGMVLYDIYLACELDRLLSRRDKQPEDSEAIGFNRLYRPKGDEIRLPAARSKGQPIAHADSCGAKRQEIFFPNDALTQAVARDSASPLAGPLTRRVEIPSGSGTLRVRDPGETETRSGDTSAKTLAGGFASSAQNESPARRAIRATFGVVL